MLKQFLKLNRKTIKKTLNAGFQLSIIFILSILSACYTNPAIIIIQNEFLMNFIGIVLGLEITLLTFIYSSFDKIYSSFAKQKDEIKKVLIQSILKKAFKELIEDTHFTMLIFGAFILTIILQDTDIPLLSWSINTISRNDFFKFSKFFCFFAVCISIFDMISSLFKMMNTIAFDNI